jgi:hypothetical protein
MQPNSPFDTGPDQELGELLRGALTAGGDPQFAARVLALLPAPGSLWDVLAGWARPGIAAAMLLAAALGYWLAPRSGAAAPSAAEVLASEQTLDRDAMASVVLGTGR